MALSAQTYQYVNQLGLTRLIDAGSGPDGPHGVTSYWLAPVGEWHNGQRIPHTVFEDLGSQNFDKTTVEGVEYYLVPEESSNLPGRLAHYAQLTGHAELANPPAGGVNRVRETFVKNSSKATVAPDTVEKYVKDNDSFEEARKKSTEEDDRVSRQVSVSPAREPAEGKLVEVKEEKKTVRSTGDVKKGA